jgi:hypothetical protein
LIFQDLALKPLLLSFKSLFVLVHQLLLGKHLLVAVEFNLLNDYEIMPVDIVLSHIFVTLILLTLRLRDALLLIKPELALLASVNDLFWVLRKGLVSL